MAKKTKKTKTNSTINPKIEDVPEIDLSVWEDGKLVEVHRQPRGIFIAKDMLHIADYHTEHITAYDGDESHDPLWIHPELEAWAKSIGRHWAWANPTCIVLVEN